MKQNLTLLTLFLAGFSLAFAGSEGKPLPKALPPYGEDRPIPAASVVQRKLSNGLTVWLVKRPGFPKVSLNLVVRGGNGYDATDRQGLTGFMAGMLTEGTTNRSSRQIAEELQTIGGNLSAFSSADAVNLMGSSLSNGLPSLLNLLADVARHPAFPAKEVELSKVNTLQSLIAQEASSSYLADRALGTAIFGSHPYAFTSIRPDLVKTITSEQLHSLHGERFRPDQALLVLSGEFDETVAIRLVESTFGEWKSGGIPFVPIPKAVGVSAHQLLLVPRPGSVQSTLRVGRLAIAAAHPDYIPMQLANVILGVDFESRIVKNIREDKGYSYHPGSSVYGQQQGGYFSVQADVRNEVTAASLVEIIYEIDRMGATTVGTDELQRSKRYLVGSYLFQNELQRAMTGTLAGYWVNGLKPEALAEFVPKVNAVSAEDVRRIGRTYFASKDQTILVVGDEAKVKSELEQFGPVQVLKP